MKVLVSTMGKSLEVGVNLFELIEKKMSISKVGFFVADSYFFKHFKVRNLFLSKRKVSLLKEWDFTSVNREDVPDYNKIASYEKKLADPIFWNALMADRRIFFGKYCKFMQDYPSRFDHDQLLLILEQALVQIENFFDSLSPELVLSFGTATMGDYLISLFAKARGIPYLQLKATKVKNYLSMYDTPCGLSSNIIKMYGGSSLALANVMDDARAYVSQVAEKGLQYEGAILSSRSRLRNRLCKGPVNVLRSLYSTAKIFWDPVTRHDCHLPCSFVSSYYANIGQPLKAFMVESKLKKHKKYVDRSTLRSKGDFVFFPLHFEPEVSIQIFGRSFQNQIELIRNIALSLPVCTKVIVKEHPRSLGFRSYSYYRKLLAIPNVYLVDPFMKGYEIVPYAKLVSVITGSIGLEAVIHKIPVITFGEAPYNILPDSMVQKNTNLTTLGSQINILLQSYSYDPRAIEKYVAAIIHNSIPVDLYSILLSKDNRYSENSYGLKAEERLQRGYDILAIYCVEQFRKAVAL